jgi:moderate conductance mechanosensitive channel
MTPVSARETTNALGLTIGWGFNQCLRAITIGFLILAGSICYGATPVAAQTEQAPSTLGARGHGVADAFNGMRQLLGRAGEVVRSVPELGDSLRIVATRLRDEAQGGASLFFLKLLVAVMLAVAAEKATRAIVVRLWRNSPRAPGQGAPPLLRVVGQALLDAGALIPLWLVLYGLSSYGLTGDRLHDQVKDIIFSNILFWRIAVLVPRIWFRPKDPALRIAALDDRDARTLYYTLSIAILGYVLAQSMVGVLIAAEAPADTIVAAGFLNNLIFTIIDYTAIFVTRHATARWLEGLVDRNGSAWASLKLQLAKYWWVIGILADTVMSVAMAYGMLSGYQNVGSGIVTSLALVLVLVFLEALCDYLQRPVSSAPLADAGDIATGAATDAAAGQEANRARPADLVARCLRFVGRLLILFAIANIWVFDVLHLSLSAEESALIDSGIRDTFVFISVAYVAWQTACFYIVRKLGGGAGGANAAQPSSPESRLRTMLPLARVALGITIAVLTILTILSRLGVNIGPLIAGASVLGLAVSFGSQTLVRDIVSGIFYLADDAFRIGEYVDAGKAKGTVEGFTLRSIKLRHQNGPLHIVPFGQLGSVTNYSRDWITLKFNLRIVRDSDLEFVRKTTKKIGVEMMADPTLEPYILEPLKMQGVTDILDNALVVRFKVMVKPGNPTLVQRQAVKRMISRFAEVGIKFPSSTVTVQTVGGGQDVQAVTAAAAAPPR